MRRFKTMGVATVALALMLAGCGKTSSQDEVVGTDDATGETAKTAAADPCGFVTAAEMTAITTDAVTETRRTDTNSCKYGSKPDDGVEVTVFPSDGKHQMEIVHKTAEVLGGMGASVADKGGAGADAANLLKAPKDKAPALGDEAVWQMNSTLAVRKGDAFVQVSPPLMHDPANHPGYPIVSTEDKKTIAVAVATKVLAKIAP